MIGNDVERNTGGRRRKTRSKRTTKQRRVKRKRGPRRGGAQAGGGGDGGGRTGAARPEAVMNYGPCFWNNYRKALEWQGQCLEGYWRCRAQVLQRENDSLRERLSLTRSQAEVWGAEDVCFSQDEEESAEDESWSAGPKYEVTQEFMDFIEISLRHKQSLNQSKNNSKENNKDTKSEEPKQTDSSDEEETWVAPEKDSGEVRSREMGELYGCESAKIHGMETAMHLSFMRKCDRTKPVVWPVLPLSTSCSHLTPSTT